MIEPPKPSKHDFNRIVFHQMQLHRTTLYTPDGGRTTRTIFKIDTEDIIALGAFFVGMCLGIAVLIGSLELNKISAGVLVALFGTAGIAELLKARKTRRAKKRRWWVWIIIAALLIAAAFGTVLLVLKA